MAQLWWNRPAGPSRHWLARWPHAGEDRVLPGQPSYSGTIGPAPADTIRHGRSALAAKWRCQGGPTTVAQSSWPQQAPLGAAAPHWQREGAAGAAWLQRHGPDSPGRLRSAQRPHAGSEGALPGGPAYGGTVRRAPAGFVWCNILAPAARGRCQGRQATVAWSSRPWQAEAGVVVRHWQQSSIAGAAPARWHCLASPVQCCSAWHHGPCDKGALPGRPSYGSTGWLAMAGAVRCGSSSPLARGRCRGSPATAALSSLPQQAPSGAAALHRQQGGTARAARQQQHWPDSTNRCCQKRFWHRQQGGSARAAQLWRYGLAGPGRRPGAGARH